jgi:hypothetical protein
MKSSQECLHQGYKLLVQHIPNLKARLVDQDVLVLNNYFRDVSFSNLQSSTYSNWTFRIPVILVGF